MNIPHHKSNHPKGKTTKTTELIYKKNCHDFINTVVSYLSLSLSHTLSMFLRKACS